MNWSFGSFQGAAAAWGAAFRNHRVAAGGDVNALNDQCGKSVALRLDGHALDALLPFRIVLDRSLEIVELGPSIRKLCPAILLGASLSNHFRIMRPTADARWEEIQAFLEGEQAVGVDGLRRLGVQDAQS